ncbi:LamG-like jellyroll fold domain-containing protein [Luteolibacter marinus]|uniref:LamG-like jellyroll fold domain-containing protein n=1 Tax=Luteolibacter marinus TaxID=2776705 RepID=UPI0018660356|nr:LamG-like jellyroll fold domain-containing protein [Luteolibacter marinus]
MNGRTVVGFIGLVVGLALTPCRPAGAATGPLVGTVTTDEAWLLYRPGAQERPLRLSVLDAAGEVVATSEAACVEADDYVAKFHVSGLHAATSYRYRIDDIGGAEAVTLAGPEEGLGFKTALQPGGRGMVRAAFASCANNTSEPVWQRIGMIGIDQLFLCGDTPYVDVGDLATIRVKHRAFLETPFLASLIRRVPTAGTWDDHDFGLNGGNGVSTASRKENTRRGFVEYRAHDQFGEGQAGVYHKIDRGVMEVFLLDPRWYSQTGASPVDADQMTCFGPAQWQWIRDSLLASRAPFKVLVMGQVWQDKKNSETDDMFTYWYERDALLDFIRDQRIPGVVLVGGDIHVSRHLVHPQRVGYDLHDFITSPAHTSVIPSLDVAHPDLVWSSQQPRQFLTLEAETRVSPAVLTARFYLSDGTIQREVIVTQDQLAPREGRDLGKGLRAWWDFEGDSGNRSVLGGRVDAAAMNCAALVAEGGLRGGAMSFSRAAGQYLVVPGSALDDNSAGHTVSMWCKPASLPADGTTERHFLMESTLGSAASDDAGYSISISLRAGASADKVNLELFTRTLQPATGVNASPTELAQGGFGCELDRTLFTGRWAHVAMSFDSRHLRLYIDGVEAADHLLPVPGPAAECGGLIIGGHRAGTGRNFDGMLDEVALWQRVIGPEEIATLYHDGSPVALPIAVAAIDTDGDTLEDWYEVLNGMDPQDPSDVLADIDSDGVPAYLERMAGTHPGHDDSGTYDSLRNLLGLTADAGGLVFRNPAGDSLRFRLTLASGADPASWEAVVPDAATRVSPTGGRLEIVTPDAGQAERFFRLEATE